LFDDSNTIEHVFEGAVKPPQALAVFSRRKIFQQEIPYVKNPPGIHLGGFFSFSELYPAAGSQGDEGLPAPVPEVFLLQPVLNSFVEPTPGGDVKENRSGQEGFHVLLLVLHPYPGFSSLAIPLEDGSYPDMEGLPVPLGITALDCVDFRPSIIIEEAFFRKIAHGSSL
jgi:hypothetical protein